MDDERTGAAWRVVVTNGDVAAAKRAWLGARDGGAHQVTVEARFDLYRRLISAQAQQVADDFRARPADGDSSNVP